MGTMYLLVPELRNGGYIPSFLTVRRRSEAALIEAVREAYVSGVFTCRMECLVKSLGVDSMSRSQGRQEQGVRLHSQIRTRLS